MCDWCNSAFLQEQCNWQEYVSPVRRAALPSYVCSLVSRSVRQIEVHSIHVSVGLARKVTGRSGHQWHYMLSMALYVSSDSCRKASPTVRCSSQAYHHIKCMDLIKTLVYCSRVITLCVSVTASARIACCRDESNMLEDRRAAQNFAGSAPCFEL
jgi:hypothetical protein